MEALLQELPNLVGSKPLVVTPLGDEDEDEDLTPVLEWIADQPGQLYSETRIDFGQPYGFENLTGTGDLTWVEPHRLTIGDLKFGRGIVEVESNRQLMVYLAGAINRFGPRDEYRLVILQPRAWHEDGAIREYVVSHAEFLVFEFDLVEAIEANYGNGKCHAGDHCRKFCPALGTCVEARRHARQRLTAEADE